MGNKRQKFLVFILVLAMMFSLCTSVFAAETESMDEEPVQSEQQTDVTAYSEENLSCNYIFTQSDGDNQLVVVELGESSETILESASLDYQDADGAVHTVSAETVEENAAAFLLDSPAENAERTFISVTAVADGQQFITELSQGTDMETVTISEEEVAETVDQIKAEETGIDEETAQQIEECVISSDETGITSQDIEEAVEESLELAPGIENYTSSRSAKSAASAQTDEKKTYIVVLDPGHGTIDTNGYDPGSSHTFSGGPAFVEADITMKIAKYVKEALAAYPEITVYMTHDTVGSANAIKMTLNERVEYAADKNADLLVSLHLNAFDSETAHGAEVLVPRTGRYNTEVAENAGKAAANILKRLVKLGLTDRGLVYQDSSSYKYPDGSKADYYAIVRGGMEKSIPAIIVEHAFLSGKADIDFLNSDAAIKNLAKADAYGIAQYFGIETGGEVYEEIPEKAGYWKKEGSRWYYYKGSVKQTGWQEINGVWYYLNSSGVMQTGWQKVGGSWYYLNASGAMLTGWQKVGGSWYYLNTSGAMLTGWQKINDLWYYLNSSGAMLTGWQKIGNSWYYLNASGAMQTGWQKVGGSWYYLNASGVMLTGWQKLDGKWYYLNSSGAMAVGWVQIKGIWYYMDESGAMAESGWTQVKGKWYYLLPGSGAMQSGWFQINGSWHYSDKNGARQTGWIKLGQKWYYLFPDKDGAMAEGWTQVNEKWYYLLPGNGAMQSGWFKIDGVWHYSDGNGARQTGWIKLGKKWYYLLPDKDGAMAEGWIEVSDKKYYLQPGDGAMCTGWLPLDEKWYYLDVSGEMLTGWQKIKGSWYYMETSGVMLTGWQEIEGKSYYFNTSGVWIENYIDTRNLYAIAGESTVTAEQMVKYYKESGAKYPSEELSKGGAPDIETFAELVLKSAEAEGIKAEVVFIQAMKETGWLQFGGDVKIQQFNFAGLGATGGGVAGNSFKDVEEGIMAQVQHLKAYASEEKLNTTCVDTRFTYVKRNSAPYVEWLGIPDNPTGAGWAANKDYGKDLLEMINKLKTM